MERIGFVGLGIMGRHMAGHLARAGHEMHVYNEHFIKDLGIALEEAARMGLELPGLALAKRLYDDLAACGHGRDGTQVLFRHYEG